MSFPFFASLVDIQRKRIRAYLFCALWLMFLPISSHSQQQQQPSPQATPTPAAKIIKLGKLEFAGLQRRTNEEAVAASELQIGQTIDIPTLDAAAERLMSSGLFKGLSYRYRTVGDQAVVTFQVEEAGGKTLPVVFDNFVWFSDEELESAVRRQVPVYDGSAPDGVTDTIVKVLQSLLQSRNLPGRVEYTPSANLVNGKSEHLFSVEGVKLPICAVRFSGAQSFTPDELLQHSQALINEDYRRSFVLSFAEANLIPLYRERGFLRAEFRAPGAQSFANAGDEKCANGVAVTLPIDEGIIYVWDKAEWGGNAALTNAQLDAALGMKSGERANGVRIDKGLEAAREAYGRKGYLAAKIMPEPAFDDTARRVLYRLNIQEGAQYRMGILTIIGLPENVAAQLREKWKLKTGDVYDASYLKEFMKQQLAQIMKVNGITLKKFSSQIKTDPTNLAINLTLNFE